MNNEYLLIFEMLTSIKYYDHIKFLMLKHTIYPLLDKLDKKSFKLPVIPSLKFKHLILN